MKTPIPPDAKICLTAKNSEMKAEIAPHFGLSPYYLILDPVAMQIEAIRNPDPVRGAAAGVRSARLLVDKGVRIILTGQVGSQAAEILDAAGVKVIGGTTGTVGGAIRDFAKGVENAD